MRASLKRDIDDLSDAMASIAGAWSKLTMAEKIDAAARIGSTEEMIKSFRDAVKDGIKKLQKGVEGEIDGEAFKAILQVVPSSRLDQKALKENQFKIYNQYLKKGMDERVTFKPR